MDSLKSQSPKGKARRRFGSITRRTFLKLSAVAAAALTAGRLLWRPALGSATPEEADAGGAIAETWVPTSCLNCPSRCATLVRVVDGRAVKITGNTLSKVSEGETCPRAHVGLQVLYDPERITTPLRRTNPARGKGIDPGWEAISWGEALDEVAGRLKSLRDGGEPHRLLILNGLNPTSDEDITRYFARSYGTPNFFAADVPDGEADRAGGWLADGHYARSAYDLENTNYILAFGASILESEKPVARNLRMWGKIRRERPNRAKIVVIDPRYSVTAAKSDRWVPVNPGTDGALAMAIANVIISENLYDAEFVSNFTSGFNEYKDLALTSYSPESAAGITGVPAETIRDLAREFARTKPAIAWRGRGATAWPGGTYASYAIYCLNALVGSIDVPGGVTYQEAPAYRPLPEITEDSVTRAGLAMARLDGGHTGRFPLAGSATNRLADSIREGQPYPVEILLGLNGNPVMTAPENARWHEALAKIPYYVHVAPFVNETAEYADIVLPATTFLETWGYEQSPPGSGSAEVKLKQPVVAPLGEARNIGDTLFYLALRTGGGVLQAFEGIGGNTEGFVKYRTENLIDWDDLLRDGVWRGADYEYYKYDRVFDTPSGKFEFSSGNLAARLNELGLAADSLACLPHYEPPAALGDAAVYPLMLSTYRPLLTVENGSQNYPWAQEALLVMHGRAWENLAEMNRRTAEELGISDGDAVWVESPYGRVRVKARVFEGIMPGVVSIAGGQGYYACGRWADGIGVNPNDITGADYDALSGQSAFFNTRVRVYRA